MARTCTIITALLLALSMQSAQAVAAEAVITLKNFEADAVQMAGFELQEKATVAINAVGLRAGRGSDLSAYAWIIDSQTRQPVWVMDERDTERLRGESRLLRSAQEELQLESGRYELYFYAGTRQIRTSHWDGVKQGRNIVRNLRRWSQNWHWDGDQDDLIDAVEEDCFVTLNINANIKKFTPSGKFSDTVFRFAELGNGEYTKTGFSLKKDMDLRIYALAEYVDDWRNPADYGWITNSDTGERVWEIDQDNTAEAGGAEKNRIFDDTVHLNKGEYVLTFGTDDSHSFEEFNAPPPFDPLNWGITIIAATDSRSFAVTKAPDRGKPVVDLAGVRDHDFKSQAFELKKNSSLRVYAMGEYDYGNRDFADYGWIENAAGDVVWEMSHRNTRHAGGAEKNRLFDDTIDLKKGFYVAFYSSDDSHSYRRWNSGAPFDGESWGLGIYAAKGTKSKDIKLVSEKALKSNSNVLVRIIHVGDHEQRRETFTLDKSATVRIYALGEGIDGQMYDYGYIENSKTGELVWEMTWRRTRHAGGARKNRKISKDITLGPGSFEVFYETDDSHSFSGWNARRPDDPRSWGITVEIAGKE